jgi:hypothetical protein
VNNLSLYGGVFNPLLYSLDRHIFSVSVLDSIGNVFCDMLNGVVICDCLLHGNILLNSLLFVLNVGTLDGVVLEPRLTLDWCILVGTDTHLHWALGILHVLVGGVESLRSVHHLK